MARAWRDFIEVDKQEIKTQSGGPQRNHAQLRLPESSAAGGLWPAARLRAADERYDGLMPKMRG